MRRLRNLVSIIPLLIVLILLSGCLQQSTNISAPPSGAGVKTGPWIDMELTDVATGEIFRISDFKGRPVLLESFAVWCPTCTEQQKKTKELKSRVGEIIVHVSLDTDPNEDVERVREHINTNEFEWYYAVSPVELTQALIDEFGLKVVNAPAVPMILVCADLSTRFLRRGIKTSDDMLAEIETGC